MKIATAGCFLVGSWVLAAVACAPATQLSTERVKETCSEITSPDAQSAWVSDSGATIRIQGKSTHHLVVKQGTVPTGQRYLYTVAEVGGAGNGCTMVAAQVTPGGINDAPDAYTLKIHCKNPGNAGTDQCDPAGHTTVLRIEPDPDTLAATVDADRKYISVPVRSLSTYALAAPVKLD